MAMISLSSFNGADGFSFISVLFLLMVLATALSVGYMAVAPAQRENISAETLARMEVVRVAVVAYRSHHGGAAPILIDNLVTQVGAACTVDTNTASATYRMLQGWCGPYIDRPISQNPNQFKSDGWGTLFQYSTTLLTSCGLNRTCGDADDVSIAL